MIIKYFHFNEFASKIPDLIFLFVFISGFKCVSSDQVLATLFIWPAFSSGLHCYLPFNLLINCSLLSSSFIHSLSLVWLNKALRLRIATKLVSFIINVKSIQIHIFMFFNTQLIMVNNCLHECLFVTLVTYVEQSRSEGQIFPTLLMSNLMNMWSIGYGQFGLYEKNQEWAKWAERKREWGSIVTFRVGPGTGLIQICFSIFLFMNCTESFISLCLSFVLASSLALLFIRQMYGNHFLFSLYTTICF